MVDPESFVSDEQNINIITRKNKQNFSRNLQRSVKISAKVKHLSGMLTEGILSAEGSRDSLGVILLRHAQHLLAIQDGE